jgi:hypothetical protein
MISDYELKLKQEIERFKNVENVHDLSEIFHYWSHTHLRPILNDAGYESIDAFFI